MSAGTPPTARQRLDHILVTLSQKPGWVIGFAVLFALGPFLGKPFNLDDPLFIWAAQHIQEQPLNPYDFKVNWYGWDQPMWDVTKNPPLVCYYLAAWASLAGWSEVSLHTALLWPALAAIWGTHRLARRFCKRPLLAALATLFTPVFLVSGTTVMCDVFMLAGWVWALGWWMEGYEKHQPLALAGAAVLVGLAGLTKYFGACLLPLLVVWSLLRERTSLARLAWLVIPIAMLVGYQILTRQLYGHGHVSDAGAYAMSARKLLELDALNQTAIALAFAGGCLAVVVCFAPLLWRWRTLALALVVAVVLAALFHSSGWVVRTYVEKFGAPRLALATQTAFWVVAGFGVVALAVADLRRRHDANAWLLGLWLAGTFMFAAWCNWMVTARTLLPMAPAVGILLVRRLEDRASCAASLSRATLALAGGAAVSLGVARSDFLFATAMYETVAQVSETYPAATVRLWFQGHWGFQYYMQLSGARAMDVTSPAVAAGERVALPSPNTNMRYFNAAAVSVERNFSVPIPLPLTTHSPVLGGGFHASAWGPVPFALGRVPPAETVVYVLKPSVAPAASP